MSTLIYKAAALAAALAVFGATPLARASAAGNGPDHQVKSHCFSGGRSWERLPGGVIARSNIYEPGVRQLLCVKGDGFTVAKYWRSVAVEQRLHNYDVGSYPDIQFGCNIWGLCSPKTPGDVLASRIKSLDITDVSRFPSNGGRQQGNDSTDQFFTTGRLDKTDGMHAIRAELMLWTHWQGIGTGTLFTVRAAGITWQIDSWITHQTVAGVAYSWTYIQCRHAGARLVGYNEMPLIRALAARGLIRLSAWDLAGTAAGFEAWRFARGDAITNFQVKETVR